MLIEDIRLMNFRNYDDLYVELNKKINIFIGDNAQGKTNLLESIYMASLGSSFRTNRDSEIIKFHKDKGYIGLNFISNSTRKFLEIDLYEEGPKKIRINKLELTSLKELERGFNAVLFSPDDLDLVKGSPGVRRKFLDMTISELKPIYRHSLSRYNKILYQRNNLLKTRKKTGDIKALIEVFNLQLADIGSDIILYRKSYLDNLGKIARKAHNSLTDQGEELSLAYRVNLEPQVYNKDYINSLFLDRLDRTLEKDLILGRTEMGPHRDDFDIYINNIKARNYGSQGQKRTAVLSIKLSEVEIIYFERGEYPILLLDDVFSELDESRRRFLTTFLKKTQTIITSTDLMELDELEDVDMSVFQIEEGKLRGR